MDFLTRISPIPTISHEERHLLQERRNNAEGDQEDEFLLSEEERIDLNGYGENWRDDEDIPKFLPHFRSDRRRGKVIGMVKKGIPSTLDMTLESLNYELPCSKLRFQYEEQNQTKWKKKLAYGIMIFIGIATGLTAFFILYCIDYLSKWKYYLITAMFKKISAERFEGPSLFTMFQCMITAVGLNLLACGIAAFCGVQCPVSCGSGIPHIKAYLNGIKIPELLRIRTLFYKVFGVIFSVVGGMPVGKEGPMIHSGAVHGGGLSQGLSSTFGWNYIDLFHVFRNDASKRDFVAGGAAAGVAAAFGAPLGGLLFAIEEGCSHLDLPIIFKVILASTSSYLTLNTCKSVYMSTKGELGSGGLINFGYFKDESYNITEYLLFFIVGAIGALLGALWNYLNKRITQFRMLYITSKTSKFIEVLVVSFFVTALSFLAMYAIEDCQYIHYLHPIKEYYIGMTCPDGKYSAGAEIWFETPENSVKDMFHADVFSYHLGSLSLFCILYFLMSCVTYGLTISSGLFIPSLLIGAAWGRIFGTILVIYFPELGIEDVGKFSLMGASAQLSGIVRLTVSLCVILIEATGGMTYAFPILTVVITSKVIGDMFNHGIYDIHLNLSGVPILEWNPPANTNLNASNVMASPVRCLHLRSTVPAVLAALRETQHSAFPIVDPVTQDEGIIGHRQKQRSYGILRGLMLRQDILTMLHFGLFETGSKFAESWEIYQSSYPRGFDTNTFLLQPCTEYLREGVLDFRNIVNIAPQKVTSSLGFDRVFHQFRSTGARHIVVVNDYNEVVGMITRKDLAKISTTSKGFCKSGPHKTKVMTVPARTSVLFMRTKELLKSYL